MNIEQTTIWTNIYIHFNRQRDKGNQIVRRTDREVDKMNCKLTNKQTVKMAPKHAHGDSLQKKKDYMDNDMLNETQKKNIYNNKI